MATWEWNGHVTDDVTWPWRVKVVTQMCLWLSISKTAEDTDLVPMDHQWEMAHWDSNGHVTDDVTWLRKIKVIAQIYLEPVILITAGDTNSDLVPMEHL